MRRSAVRVRSLAPRNQAAPIWGPLRIHPQTSPRTIRASCCTRTPHSAPRIPHTLPHLPHAHAHPAFPSGPSHRHAPRASHALPRAARVQNVSRETFVWLADCGSLSACRRGRPRAPPARGSWAWVPNRRVTPLRKANEPPPRGGGGISWLRAHFGLRGMVGCRKRERLRRD